MARRKAWTMTGILTAFYRFYLMEERWPGVADLQEDPGLPSLRTVHDRYGPLDLVVTDAERRYTLCPQCHRPYQRHGGYKFCARCRKMGREAGRWQRRFAHH